MVDDPAVDGAVEALTRGGLVAFPTDTVYGLGCLARDADARARFYTVKGRPESQPAILMVAALKSVEPWAVLGDRGRELAEEFWPGPLTLVLRATPGAETALGHVVSHGTLAVRIPNQAVALALLAAVAEPLCTSSANRAGEPPGATAAEVRRALGADVAVVLEGEPGDGQPSSILDLTGPEPKILRQGAIPEARLLR